MKMLSRASSIVYAPSDINPKPNRERLPRQKLPPTLVGFHPPYVSHTRPQYASVHHGKAARLRLELSRRSARPIRGRRSQPPPVQSNRRDTPMGPRFHVGGNAYELRIAIVRSIDFRTSDARARRWAPACTAMQAKKITLGVHDTINPSKNPSSAVITAPSLTKRPRKA
jgi:hypothetical protein